MCMGKTTHMVWNMTKQFVYMCITKYFMLKFSKLTVISVVLYFIKIVALVACYYNLAMLLLLLILLLIDKDR